MKKQILKTFWILSFLLCSTSFAENAAQTATTAKAQTATIQTTAAEKKQNCRNSNRCIGKSRNRCCFPPCIGDSPNRRRSNRTQPRTANEDLRIRRHSLR